MYFLLFSFDFLFQFFFFFFSFRCISKWSLPLATPPPFSLSLVRSFFSFISSPKETRKIKRRSTFKSLVSRLTWMIDWLFDWSTGRPNERSPFYASWIVTHTFRERVSGEEEAAAATAPPPRRRAFSFFSVLYCLESSVVYSRLYYNKLLWFLVILTFLDPSVYRF